MAAVVARPSFAIAGPWLALSLSASAGAEGVVALARTGQTTSNITDDNGDLQARVA